MSCALAPRCGRERLNPRHSSVVGLLTLVVGMALMASTTHAQALSSDALDNLPWDVFSALSMLCAHRPSAEAVSGVLAFAGLIGVIVGDMRPG